MNAPPEIGENYMKDGFLFHVDDVQTDEAGVQILKVYVLRWPVEDSVIIGRLMFVDVAVWEREMFDAVRVVEDQ